MKKLNKKNFMIGLASLAIAIGAAVNVGIFSKSNDLSTDLTLANVEALAKTYAFNNQEWNDEDWKLLGDWKPVVIACTSVETTPSFTFTTGGSISYLGAEYTWNGVTISFGGKSTSYNGLMVQCQGGNGNCFNGTKCLGIAVNV